LADESQRGCEAVVAATLPPSRAGWITVAVYLLVGLAAVLIAPGTAAVTALLAVGGVLAALSALQAEARWRGRRALATDPHRDEPYLVELSAEGIRIYCDHVDARITWAGITCVEETAEFYLFLRGSSGGPAVPKRALSDSDDQQLRELVRRWSPDRGAGLAREVSEPVSVLNGREDR